MVTDKYRKTSLNLFYTTLIVMLVSTFSFALFNGVWLEKLIVLLYGFIFIVMVAVFVLIIKTIRQISLDKQKRKSLISTVLILLANIPILILFACIQLFLVLTSH